VTKDYKLTNDYFAKAVQKGSFAVITQKCNKTANINVKKLQFIHKLTASDTSKTAKITTR